MVFTKISLIAQQAAEAIHDLVERGAKLRVLGPGDDRLLAVHMNDDLDDPVELLLHEHDLGRRGPRGILRERCHLRLGTLAGLPRHLAVSFGDLDSHLASLMWAQDCTNSKKS